MFAQRWLSMNRNGYISRTAIAKHLCFANSYTHSKTNIVENMNAHHHTDIHLCACFRKSFPSSVGLDLQMLCDNAYIKSHHSLLTEASMYVCMMCLYTQC